MTTEDKGKLFILFAPLFTLSLLSKIVWSLCALFRIVLAAIFSEMEPRSRLSTVTFVYGYKAGSKSGPKKNFAYVYAHIKIMLRNANKTSRV